jgi:imidazolonepropionase-like amidohydrolase
MIEVLSMVAALALQAGEKKKAEVLPLETTRRIEFETDEATWLSLDVAPDGQSLLLEIAGGRVGIGSHGQLQGLGYHWEMWSLASGGLTPMETLRAATLHGAQIVGLAQDLGSIEPGKLADLVVLDENPLADIHNTNTVRYVVKNGEVFEGSTLDRIWPSEKKLRSLWWWTSSPNSVGGVRD